MRKTKFFVALAAMLFATSAVAQRGYYNAPYTRYEADVATGTGTVLSVSNSSSASQQNIAYEGSERKAVQLSSGQFREWTVDRTFRGIVVRAAGADNATSTNGKDASAKIYINGAEAGTLTFQSSWGWKNLTDNSNYVNTTNRNPRMRYDEQRYLHNTTMPSGTKIRIESTTNNLFLDFIEIEDVAPAMTCPAGYTQYNGNGSDLQSWLDSHGGNVFIPEGTYNVPQNVNIGGGGRTVQGAGMWYTTLHFTGWGVNNLGISAYATVNLKDMRLTSGRNSRSDNHKGLNGGWKTGSVIENVWVEHFECGAWFQQGTEGLTIRHCRFRSNYADGINFCTNSNGNTVEFCNFRNNGDDDMAVWPANGPSNNNTYRFSTAEHCWFASSCALYGGSGNKWENIIVRDNWDVGLRSNSSFGGSGFGSGNLMSNIDVIRCGTTYGPYDNGAPLAAIDLQGATNVRLECINIIASFGNDRHNTAGAVTMCGVIGPQGTVSDGNCSCTALVPESVTIVASRTPLATGEKFTFTAKVNPDGVTQTVTWASSNPAVATVNPATGEVEGKTAGTAIITATSTQDPTKSASVNIEVKEVKVTDITFANQTVGIGNATLAFSVAPDNANNKTVVFEIVSGGDKLEIVNAATGQVQGLAEGDAVVKITAQDGSGVSKQATITVTNCTPVAGIDLEVIDITWSPANPQPGEQVTFTATVRNNGNAFSTGSANPLGLLFTVGNNQGTVCDIAYTATADNYIWSDQYKSQITAIAACSTVTLTANGGANGSATWTAGAEGNWYVCADVNNPVDNNRPINESNVSNNRFTKAFTVSNAPQPVLVSSISIAASTQTVTAGESVTFSVSNILPADADNKNVTYAIVAGGTGSGTLNATTGVLTGTTEGTIRVQATAADASGVESNIVEITVKAATIPVTGITISATTPTTIIAGETVTFTAQVTPSNATNQDVTFEVVSGEGSFSGNVFTASNNAGEVVVRAIQTGNTVVSNQITITVNPASACSGTWDLIVEDFTWSPSDPQVGDEIIFTATIKNTGGTPTPDGQKHGIAFDIVSGVWGQPSEYWLAATWNGDFYGSLAACDGTQVLSATGGSSGKAWIPEEAGTYDVRAWVSNDGLPAGEANTANNQMFKSVTVTPKTGITDVETNGKYIIAYGNTVEIRGIERGEVLTVYNALGTKVYSASAASNPEFITTLSEGIYVVQIEGSNVVKKVLIVR